MVKPGNIKVFSFDFGGTLAYETTDDHIIFQEVLKELGYSFNQDKIKEAMKHEELGGNMRRIREYGTKTH